MHLYRASSLFNFIFWTAFVLDPVFAAPLSPGSGSIPLGSLISLPPSQPGSSGSQPAATTQPETEPESVPSSSAGPTASGATSLIGSGGARIAVAGGGAALLGGYEIYNRLKHPGEAATLGLADLRSFLRLGRIIGI